MKQCFVESIALSNFRNHSSFVQKFASVPYIIHGKNGSGKTNLLEALSLLSSSKGLRNASNKDLITSMHTSANIKAKIFNYLGLVDLECFITNNNSEDYNKTYYIDNKPIKNVNAIIEQINCIWLTPQMDNFFLQDNTSKRKFMDRMVASIISNHNSYLNEYSNVLSERNKLLKMYTVNHKWLDIIDDKLVSLSAVIVANRLDFINKINSLLTHKEKYPIKLSFTGIVEELFEKYNYASKVESIIKESLASARQHDIQAHTTNVGAHKSKLVSISLKHSLDCESNSTGEQKFMLLNIITSFVELVVLEKKTMPILLLDELNVHLDKENTLQIIKEVLRFNGQVFITTTNATDYKSSSLGFEFLSLE